MKVLIGKTLRQRFTVFKICSVKLLQKNPKWKAYAILILLGILVVALWKGCVNNKPSVDQLIIDSLSNRVKYLDSIGEVNKIDHFNSVEIANGLVEIANNRVAATELKNDSLNKRIVALLNRYKTVAVSVDTNVTTVENSFINDCTECFELLDNSKQLTLKLRGEHDNIMKALKSKISIQDNRINQLDVENNNLRSTLSSSINTARSLQDKNKPRGRLFFTVALIGQKETLLIGGGGGLVYMDKRSRLYGGNYYGTNLGPMWTATLSFPLSFKNK